MAMMTRKSKWQYPQVGPPAPRILQLPRRHSVRRNTAKGLKTTPSSSSQKDQRVKLEVLFHQERFFDRGTSDVNDCGEEEEEGSIRGKVADGREIGGSSSSSTAVDEAKWRFQAEMLRSECNLLRIEKQIAMKKMEKRKKRMERTLRSAVLTLLSGKQRISEGKIESKVVQDEISYFVEKLSELKSPKVKHMEATTSRYKFDKQASVLRKEQEKFDDAVSEEIGVKRIQKMAEASFLVNSDQNVLRNSSKANIDSLSSKMVASSKGIFLERMEKEYGSRPVSKCIGLQDASVQDMYNKANKVHKEKKDCSSRQCKAIVMKIADEVRAEAEQWSKMQETLNQVRKEMEELQLCRDFWQNRALESDSQIQTLHSSVEGWRRKAVTSEAKLRNIETEVRRLQEEIKILRKEDKLAPEKNKLPSESEKRVLICRLKENRHSNNGDWSKNNEGKATQPSCSRLPLREIKNGSVTARQRNSNFMKM